MRAIRVVPLLVCLALAAAAAPGPAQARYTNFDCVWKHGPEYRYTAYGSHRKGTGYYLEGFGTTCKFAKRWVGVLAKQKWHGTNKVLHGGPPGWRCKSARHGLPKLETVAYGNCQNIKDDRRVFEWQTFGETQDA